MEKKKIRFNVVDFVVIAAVIVVIAFSAFKLGGVIVEGIKKDKDDKEVFYRMTFYTEESTMYSLEEVELGDVVSDDTTGVEIGEVTKLDIKDESCAQIETAEGTYAVAPRPGYGSGSVVFEGEGLEYEHGAKFEYSVYSIGQTVTLRVGDAKLYGRIRDIEVIEDAPQK